MELQLSVSGMTCDHCVRAVTDAVRSTTAGDVDISVDLDAGAVTVRGEDLDPGAVVEAITEAGYEPAAT